MRNSRLAFTCCSLALLAITFDCAAEQAERPTPFVGYQMSYNGRVMGVPCTEWKITEIKANSDIVSTCKSYVLESSGKNDFNPIRLSTMHGIKLIEFAPFAPILKFPLAVGQQWHSPYTVFSADTGLISEVSADCKVAAYESVTVPAGALNAFRIECVDKWTLGAQTGLIHTTRWYSPEAAVMIKSENKEDPLRWNFELTSYGLDGAKARAVAATPTTSAAPAAAVGPSTSLDQVAPIKEFDDY